MDRARDLIEYIDRSPTPYQAVEESVRRLRAAGFTPLSERDAWRLTPGTSAYVTRNGSSVIAFQVGKRAPAQAGFRMIGAHTDSPNLKLKPRGAYNKSGYRQIGVEVYGGVLFSTWLDRDLSVAGRVSFRGKSGIETRLVDLKRPLLRIPNLAIHLDRQVNTEGLKLNAQNHLPPVWGVEGKEDGLMKLVAEQAQLEPKEILDHDLSLYDTQKGALGGAEDAFVFTARLDNLASCHAGLSALLDTAGQASDATRVIALWDHEEVGSRSAQGAAGPFLRTTLERIVDATSQGEPQAYARAVAASILVSADMAHAVHPNYADKHEPMHMPVIGKGPVIKTNANQGYATDAESSGHFVALARELGIEPQAFVARTDLGCGSTIGPITAALLGVKTVDVGNPMLSMHSAREMAGAADVEKMIAVLGLHLRA